MSTCLFGPTLTLGDILVIIAYTQKPRENVDADIHVSSGDRGLNSTAIYHLHSYFTLTSLYYNTDFPSRESWLPVNAISTKRLRIG